MKNQNTQPGFVRFIRKFSLSTFVVVSFIGYALHNRSAFDASSLSQVDSPQQNPQPSTPTETQPPANLAFRDPPPANTPAVPTNTPQVSVPNTSGQPAQNGQYKDGTYTGPEVDVNFGLVQVQAVIRNGKISDIQFLEYPTDRRTSRRINTFAVPILQREAVQAQSASVNLITGATLTSEGFEMSLQAALNQAKGVQ